MKKVICLIFLSCFGHVTMPSQEIDQNTDQLFDRLATGHATVAEIENLIKAGAQVNFQYKKDGTTPLMYGLEFSNSLDVIKLLLDNGANVNSKDKNKRTPLFYALEFNGSLPLIELLIKNGADWHAIDVRGLSIIEFAEYYEDVNSINYLKKLDCELKFKQMSNWVNSLLLPFDPIEDVIIPDKLSEEDDEAMNEYDNFVKDNFVKDSPSRD